MSQEVGQTELKAKTQQLLDGPLKHIRAAAIAAALLPLASVAATPASAQTASCASGGVICGYVFNDTNTNGVWDAGEPALEGVTVVICQVCDGNDTVETETGPTGEYKFKNVLGGGTEYTVSALIPTGTQASPSNVPPNEDFDSDGVPNGAGYSVASHVTIDGYPVDFGFVTSAAPNPGTGTPGYWKNHPEAWPVSSIVVGGRTYTKAQAIGWLGSVSKDKTTTIFASYVSAWLNTHIGNDATCVSAAMTAADAWLALHPVGSIVAASSTAWQGIEWAHQTMDAYNNGQLCAPHRQ
jgi:hypothetical protein